VCEPVAGGPLAIATGGFADAIAARRALDAGARAALARGEVLVLDPGLTGADGRVELRAGDARPVRLPAHTFLRGEYLGALPSALISARTAREHGWDPAPAHVLVRYAEGATPDQVDVALDDAQRLGDATAMVERERDAPGNALLLAIAAAAAFVALVGVGISVSLAAAEGRADLATMAAVGAPPRRRRAFAAGQALVVAGLGCALGVGFGAFVAFTSRATFGAPGFLVPWSTLALTGIVVPLLAVAVATIFTPSRLPLARRAT
jgi:putative ABC transport system permease protein